MLVAGILNIGSSQADHFIAEHVMPADRDYAARFRTPLRRRQSLGSRAILRHLIVNKLGHLGSAIVVGADEQGYPKFVAAPFSSLNISLSHSRELAVAALTDLGPIGIDVEWSKPERMSPEDMIRFMIDPSLWQRVTINDKADFYRLWTLIESIIKATRTLPPISPHPTIMNRCILPSLERIDDINGTMWFAQAQLFDYAIALTVKGVVGAPTIPQIDWPSDLGVIAPAHILEFH